MEGINDWNTSFFTLNSSGFSESVSSLLKSSQGKVFQIVNNIFNGVLL